MSLNFKKKIKVLLTLKGRRKKAYTLNSGVCLCICEYLCIDLYTLKISDLLCIYDLFSAIKQFNYQCHVCEASVLRKFLNRGLSV